MVLLGCAPLRVEFDALSGVPRFGGRVLPPVLQRTARDLRSVLLDVESGESDRVLYRVWRNVCRREDAHVFGLAGLEYDVTVLDSVFVKPERNKTFGHYHSVAVDGLEYPEVYEVLFGEALFLLQRHAAPQAGEVTDVLVVEARPGDKVLVPPGWGHVSINAGSCALVLANLQAMQCSAEYELFKRKRGAAYYCLEDGSFIPNKHYHRLPPLKRVKATQLKYHALLHSSNLYASFLEHPCFYGFLRDPERFNQ
ncbi:MAG: glucose-6-phosphate isomerase family protein [Candidatus Micrarchaeia archaeon]